MAVFPFREIAVAAPDNLPSADGVAALFEAALDPDRWDALAPTIAKMIGLDGAAVVVSRGLEVQAMSVTGSIAHGLEDYQQYYHQFDPWRHRARLVRPNAVVLSSELTPESEFVKTAYYNDYARHLGMFRPMNAYIPLDQETVVAVGVEQSFAKKLLEEEDKSRLAALLPYITRAMQLRRRTQGQIGARGITVDALNQLTLGMVVCDDSGRITFLNEAAERIAVASSGALSLTNRVVSAGDTSHHQNLYRLIASVAAGGSGGGVTLVSRDGTEQVLVLVAALPQGLNAGWEKHVLIALRRPADETDYPARVLSQMFGLTAAQAQLALALYNGLSVEEVADSRGVKISTVRTQLAEALARTGTANQRDLVRLLGMLPPLRL